MRYLCINCNKEFDIPAWIEYRPAVTIPPYPYANPIYPYNWPYISVPQQIGSNYEYRIPCCTFCYSKNIIEKKE